MLNDADLLIPTRCSSFVTKVSPCRPPAAPVIFILPRDDPVPPLESLAEVQRVRNFILPAMFLSLGLSALALEDVPSAEKKTGASIEQRIEQLGSPDFRQRDQAAQLLEAEGTKILPELRKAIGHP